MAGEVKTDTFYVPGVSVLDVVARECPVSKRYGEICLRFDPHVASIAVCPFLYGLAVKDGTRSYGEARSITELRDWMATHELHAARGYTVRCLRKESAGVEPGATRPR